MQEHTFRALDKVQTSSARRGVMRARRAVIVAAMLLAVFAGAEAKQLRWSNPFMDIRVRKALYEAIDVQAIKTQVMRGLATPTGLMHVDPMNDGVNPSLEKRLPYDPVAARSLLAEAGYPGGFGFTLDCPNDRYINDEKICAAVSAMWAKIGVRVS